MSPASPLSPIIPEIRELFPDVQPIYRTKINSWHDERIRGAIEATGRKKVFAANIIFLYWYPSQVDDE